MVATDTADNGCHRLTLVAEMDPELMRVIAAWPNLAAHLRCAILALVATNTSQRSGMNES